MARKKRRPAYALGITAAILVAILAFAVILVNQLFSVRNVYIDGTSTLSGDEIMRAAQIGFGQSIRRADPDTIRTRLERLGTLEVEDVHIVYPDSVYITVRDRRESALVLIGGQLAVIDKQGYVTRIVTGAPEGFTLYISGTGATRATPGTRLDSSSARLEALQTVLTALEDQAARSLCIDLDISQPNELILTTTTGIRVKLGDSSNADKKIAWMVTAVTDLLSRGQIHGTLDVASGTKADYMPDSR